MAIELKKQGISSIAWQGKVGNWQAALHFVMVFTNKLDKLLEQDLRKVGYRRGTQTQKYATPIPFIYWPFFLLQLLTLLTSPALVLLTAPPLP